MDGAGASATGPRKGPSAGQPAAGSPSPPFPDPSPPSSSRSSRSAYIALALVAALLAAALTGWRVYLHLNPPEQDAVHLCRATTTVPIGPSSPTPGLPPPGLVPCSEEEAAARDGQDLPPVPDDGGPPPRATADDPELEAPAADLSPVFTIEPGGPVRPQEVVVAAEDPWIYEGFPGDVRLVQTDSQTGAPVRTVELPGLYGANLDLMVSDGSVVWMPGGEGDDTPGAGDRDPVLLRFDPTAAEVTTIDLPGFASSIDLVDGVPWVATTEGEGPQLEVAAYDETGPVSEVTTFTPGEDGGLLPILVPTPGGVFDCLAGAWGHTPLGDDERTDLELTTPGCNATVVDGAVLTTASEGDAVLALPSDGADPRRIELPSTVDTCTAPATAPSTPVAVLLCPVGQESLAVVEVDVEADEARAVAEVGGAPAADLSVRSTPDSWRRGDPIAVLEQRRGDETSSYLLSVGPGDEVHLLALGDDTLGWTRYQGPEVWVEIGGGWAPARPG